jgi:energy-coupling factor transporter ATP-binding protein EcfA2
MNGYIEGNEKAWRFKKFERRMIEPGSVVVIIGKKGSGKTTVLADVCHSMRGCPEVTLFQKTYRTNPIFHDVVPPIFCHRRWDRKTVSQIIAHCEKNNARRLKQGRPPIYHTLVIDDLACDPDFLKDPQLEELFMNARWLKLNILVTLQDALKIHPALRGNTDWVFALKENNPNARKRLRDHYFGLLGKNFDRIYDQMTDNRGVIILNNTGTSTNVEDQYFFWRATVRDFHTYPKLKKWKMGSKKYWAFNYQHFDKNFDKSSDDEPDDNEMVIMR